MAASLSRVTGSSSRKLALIGSNGMLACKVRELASAAGYEVVGFDLPDFDLTNRSQVLAEMGRVQPDVIVNCAAFTNVDGCETQEELATRVNGLGPGYLAEAAMAVDAVLVHISTDYVLDGRKESPYIETDPVGTLSAYGRSKLVGERAIIDSGLEHYFIIRTSWLYGPGGKNFVETIIRLAREREELRVVADQVGSPTYTGDLAEAIYNLLAVSANPWVHQQPTTSNQQPAASPQSLVPSPYGIYHFSNSGHCSWYEFAAEIVAQMQARGEVLKVKRVVPITTAEYPLPAPRPAYSVFSKDKYSAATGAEIPEWEKSLAKYLEERTRNEEPVMKNP